MKRKLNWTNRSRVHRKDLKAKLQWNSDEHDEWPSLVFEIDLENYELPDNAIVYVEAYRRQTLAFMRENWGTASRLRESDTVDLDEFSRDELPKIRVVIVEPESGKILARSASFIPHNPEEKTKIERDINLLTFDYQDLGDRIYKIDYPDTPEDYPTLVLNNTIPEVRSIMTLGKPWGRSLILSDIIQEILTEILINENETYDENGTDWKSIWLRSFSSENLLGENPPDNDTVRFDVSADTVRFDRRRWIEKATDRFCSKNNLKVALVNYMQQGEIFYD